MSVYTIEVNDDVIMEKVSEILNTVLNNQLKMTASSTKDVIAEAVKDLIYSRKDEIIELVVERASREIAKKGLVKLLEKER